MLQDILTCTNYKLNLIKLNYARENKPELGELTFDELKAFIGLLYYTSILFKSNHEDLKSLFATDGSGRDIFRCTMSLKRFLTILACLRFDDITTREQRKVEDPLAAISSIFDQFVKNSQNCYSIGELACIDEMLIGFRGRCKFRMYIGSKPEKYGIKVQILTDARTSYFYNGYVYTGKGSDGSPLSEEEKKNQLPRSQFYVSEEVPEQ